MPKRKTRDELVTILKDPWKEYVKPFLMDSPMSSSVIAGHTDISASAIRSLRNGTNEYPNYKQLKTLTAFAMSQRGI